MAQKNNQKGKRVPAYTSDRMVAHLIVGLLLVALGVMIFLANALGMTGDVFDSLRQVSRGLCGVIAIALPVIPIWGGVLLMIGIQRKPSVRPFLLAILLLVLICTDSADGHSCMSVPTCQACCMCCILNNGYIRWRELPY